MSSTGKTATLELSQFVGTDKPAWLTDYNQDMAKIDAGVKAVDDKVATKDTEIAALQTKDSELASAIAANTNRISTVETTQGTASTDILVLQQNYEQIHHEVVVETEKVTNLSTQVTTAENNVAALNTRVTTLENAPEDMHTYSTAEKQVGTWIDGSPVYEQTYFSLNGTPATNDIVIDASKKPSTITPISIDFVYQQDNSSGNWLPPINANIGNTLTQCVPALTSTEGFKIIIESQTLISYSLTIRYLKK